MKHLIFFFLISLSITCFSQDLQYDSSLAKLNLKTTSQKMVKYLADKDFIEFTNFINPDIIKLGGGKVQMAELTKKSFKDLEARGFSITDVTVEDPTNIVVQKQQLQSIIPQKLKIKTKGGYLIAKSYLIAVSNDKGKTWYFADTSGKTLEQIKLVLPNLSNQLIIPQKEQPLFYND